MKKLIALILALASSSALAQNAGWPPPAGAVAFLGVYNTSPPTLTNGQVGFAQLDANGNVNVNVKAGSGSGCAGTTGTPCIVDSVTGSTFGAQADTAWSGTGSGSQTAILKAIYGAAITGTATTGSPVPATAIYLGYNSGGNLTGWDGNVNPRTAANWGIVAPAATAPTNGIYNLGRGASTSPTEVTDGQTVAQMLTLGGKTVNQPYAPKELAALGTGSGTTTGAITVVAASGSASLKTYITSVQCARDDAGTTAIHVTFNDSKSSILVLPNNGGGGGNNAQFVVPIVTAANTAFTATPSGAITTVYCNAQGYYGP